MIYIALIGLFALVFSLLRFSFAVEMLAQAVLSSDPSVPETQGLKLIVDNTKGSV